MKKIETDVKGIANYFNSYFASIAGKLNRKIVKSKSMHLSYIGSMKRNNMFLRPTTPDDIEVLIGNMRENKGVG